jgi:signal transduction histidine kinase
VAAAAGDIERIVLDADLRSLARQEVDLEGLLAGVALQGGDRVRVEAVAGATVRGDATRLRQALANLVRNGLRHGEHVVLSVRIAPEEVTIDVVDDGPGVDPGIDVFARGVSGAGSTGYGLWLARRIAIAHGGTLELVPGSGGARFRLVLPSSDGGS